MERSFEIIFEKTIPHPTIILVSVFRTRFHFSASAGMKSSVFLSRCKRSDLHLLTILWELCRGNSNVCGVAGLEF